MKTELKEKLFNNEKLTEWEIKDCLTYFDEIETIKGEDRRWSRTNDTVIDVDGRYFMIEWEEGLTEMQPNDYSDQPYEVEKHVETKTIEIVNWTKKINNM